MKKQATLRKLFKAANQRVDKAIARYREELFGLWVETSRGKLVHAAPHAFTLIRKGKSHEWRFCDFASRYYDKFYRRGRGEKRLAEIWGNFEPFNVKQVDIAAIRKLEAAIDAAINKRERLLNELEAAGVNVYADADLWG